MAILIKRDTDSSPLLYNNAVGGFITFLDAFLRDGLGWTKPYAGTNTAVYRQPTTGANGFYLYVDDSVAGTTVTVRVYESMTGIGVGTGPVPALATTMYWIRGHDSSAHVFRAFGKGGTFYIWGRYNPTSFYWTSLAMGDFNSYRAGDAYNTFFIAETIAANTTQPNLSLLSQNSVTSSIGHYSVRALTQIGSTVTGGIFSDSARAASSAAFGAGGGAYPSYVDGAVRVSPCWWRDDYANMRGSMPGLWNICHNQALQMGDQFTCTAGLVAGRTFEVVQTLSSQSLVEISDTWGGY